MSQKFKDRDLVLPGDVVFDGGIRTGDNTYRIKDSVIATRLGLVNYINGIVTVTALEAGYRPLINDIVIGEIVEINLGEWVVDLGKHQEGLLSISDAIDRPYRSDYNMRRVLDFGDTIIAKVVDFDRRNNPLLTILGPGLGKMREGFIINLTSIKIPRLIGKKGSMINMIIKETGCRVNIGQNGRILISGPNRSREEMVVKVVNMIDREAHTSGLTNRTQDLLKKLRNESR